ncbi:unnamed protein product [Ilex paraguariensis]|uniref:GDSL esterase/lipase n=1 Tax=Ilex paraguariensis TaxID=185542 RepID=A0ABC8UHX8_9AQUA
MISTTLLLLNLGPFVHGELHVPCYFILGDALVDNGNNNGLLTHAKSNFPPYGIDFSDGQTGRFTNGRNMADIIAELLGFDSYIQPFATANGSDILKGVNYGSSAAGILDETGEQLSPHWPIVAAAKGQYLISTLDAEILYELGARTVAIFGLSLMGCTTAKLAKNGTSGSASVDTINNGVQLFNDKLKP